MAESSVEVAVSTQETIGLPNWSNVKFLVAAKVEVEVEKYEAAFSYFSALTDAYCQVHVQRLNAEIDLVPGASQQGVVEIVQPPEPVLGGEGWIEVKLTFSRTEKISLPTTEKGQNSAVDLLASASMVGHVGAEIATLDYLAAGVKKQMSAKRDAVLLQPRGWTTA